MKRNVTVVLPSLNPDERLAGVVQSLIARGFTRILLVDDGSAPDREPYFRKAADHPECELLRHPRNLGKGQALKTAFARYLELPGDSAGVVTVDGDGQHDPDDIARCAGRMAETGEVVLGARSFRGKGIPMRSRFGNCLTSAVFRFACGLKISDTQTGLRAIPNRFLPEIAALPGERFEYETNMLLHLKKQAVPFQELPIRTIYQDHNDTSHFRPVSDSARIYRQLLKFLCSSIGAAAVDFGLFWLLDCLLSPLDASLRLFLATGTARAASSLLNYTVNRKMVFCRSGKPAGSLVRYYLLCVLQALASYTGVYLLSVPTAWPAAAVKIPVDVFLFFISFQLQRRWVFHGKEQE